MAAQLISGLIIFVGWIWSVLKIFMIVLFYVIVIALFFVIVLLIVIVLFIVIVSLPSEPPPRKREPTSQKDFVSALSDFCSLFPRRPSPSRPPSTWSKQETYEATASAFSVITGVKIISEKDVQRQRELGKRVRALEIKDVFYGRLSSTQTNQEQLYYIPDSAYDPQYDHDFTNYKGDDTNCTRGYYPYKRPAGWNRKAVRVNGKYGNDVWLGQQGWRSETSPGEWPVSYHGTMIDNVPSIVAGGYDTKKCVRQRYGPGIYSTPDFKVAEDYATDFNYKGENCKCILQNRVNLKKTKEQKTPYGIYFVTPDEDDIRPYGVCIKKI